MPNLAEFKEKYPDVYQAVFDEGRAEGLKAGELAATDTAREEGRKAGTIEGAENERDRIKAVEDQLIPGHETLIDTLRFDGATTGEQAAVKVLQAEKSLRATTEKDLANDAPPDVDFVADPDAPPPADDTAKNADEAGDKLTAAAKTIQAEKGGLFSRAFDQACSENPKLYQIYKNRK